MDRRTKENFIRLLLNIINFFDWTAGPGSLSIKIADIVTINDASYRIITIPLRTWTGEPAIYKLMHHTVFNNTQIKTNFYNKGLISADRKTKPTFITYNTLLFSCRLQDVYHFNKFIFEIY